MRQIILGLVAATAVVTASAAPAAACGGRGLFTSGCSPCGGVAYVSPCGGGYASSGYYGSYGYAGGYGYGGGYGGGYGYGGVAAYQVLPQPTAQYYYANQGPVYSGPASFAPYPTYQQTSVADWGDDDGYAAPSYRSVGYSYAPAYRTSYRPWRPRPAYYGYRPRPAYYGGYARPQVRYGYSRPAYAPSYGYRSSYRYAQPRVSYAPRYGYSHQQYRGYQRPLRRLY